jgi:hypothetical protein
VIEAAEEHVEVFARVPIHLLKYLIMYFFKMLLKLSPLASLSEV